MNLIISCLVEKILNLIFNKIESAIEIMVAKDSCKNELTEILAEYEDEMLYDSLDKFITTNNTLNYFEHDIEYYLNNNSIFFANVEKIAEQFYACYKGSLYYFGHEHIIQIFAKLALCIFKYRYPIQKHSNAEIIVANVKRELQESTLRIEKKMRNFDQNLDEIKKMICDKSQIKDKKFLFVERFNQKLFLENTSENPISLRDIYVSQRYRENGIIKENIEQCLDDFLLLQGGNNNILFVVGQIATGKSSLLCKLLYKYRYRDDIIALNIKDFAKSNSLIESLLAELNCIESVLAGKILILDGYDEAKIIKEKDSNINKICADFVQALQELLPQCDAIKVIITVRTEFFEMQRWHENHENVRVLELLDFGRAQIKEFKSNFMNKKKIQKKNISFITSELNQNKLKVISNPMMLYMICYYEGELGENLSKSGIYERIFGRNGSLLLNSYKGKGRGEEEQIIEKIHADIKEMAFFLYTQNYSIIRLEDYKHFTPNFDCSSKYFPGMNVVKDNNGNMREAEFIHESICSYYAAECIYEKIDLLYEKKEVTEKIVLKTIDELFSYGNIEGEVLDFLSHFICERDLFRKELQRQVLLKSTTYVFKRNCIYEIGEDNCVFLLERIHNAFNGYWKIFMLIYSKISKENKSALILRNLFQENTVWKYMARLLKNGSFNKLDLRGANFTDLDLRCVILRDSNLSNSILINTDLRGAYLVGTKLCDAILENANLNGADLCRANFRNAEMKHLKLRGSVLKGCKFRNCKNVIEVKFSYSNVYYVRDIKEDDLKSCYVYDEFGHMKNYKDFYEIGVYE